MTSASISTIRLGQAGPRQVSTIGLGCMGMSGSYGASDETRSLATINAALDAGVNLLDSGDFYGTGHNEMLIGRALKGRRGDALLSVKFGALRGPDGGWLGYDGRPAAVKNFLAHSLRRLGTDYIDIYRMARLDSAVPIEDTIGAISDMVKAGYVRYVGLSEVGVETIQRAHAVHPISDLQIEYSLLSRRPEVAIFPELKALGIGVTAYGVLSRGLLAGSKPAGKGDSRAHFYPRFAGDNLTQNMKLVDALADLAAKRGASAPQLAIAWVRARARQLAIELVTLVGARTIEQLSEALGAASLDLSEQDLLDVETVLAANSVSGERYQTAQMLDLDSEK